MKLYIRPINLREANEYVRAMHRHAGSVVGYRFAVSVVDDSQQVHGVAIAGRPIGRSGGHPLEVLQVTRLATDGTANACSMLLGAVSRAAAAMGYKQVRTHTLAVETGTSLRAAGFSLIGVHKYREWKHSDGKPRSNAVAGDKHVWVRHL